MASLRWETLSNALLMSSNTASVYCLSLSPLARSLMVVMNWLSHDLLFRNPCCLSSRMLFLSRGVDYMAVYNVFYDLTADRCKGDWSIIGCFGPVTFLEQRCYICCLLCLVQAPIGISRGHVAWRPGCLRWRLFVREKCGIVSISSILSYKRGITPTKNDANWRHSNLICNTVKQIHR